jgi:hypothetical protein
MKDLTISVFGLEKFVDAQDCDGVGQDCLSSFDTAAEPPYNLQFTVDSKEYTVKDFANESDLISAEESAEYTDRDVESFLNKVPDCVKGVLYTNKAWGVIEIELEDDEEFNPAKAALVIRRFNYPNGSHDSVMLKFIYDGKAYDCVVEESTGKYSETIFRKTTTPANDVEITNEEASDDLITDIENLPILVFKEDALTYDLDYYDADEYEYMDRLEEYGDGIVVVVNDYDEGFAKIGNIWDSLKNMEEDFEEAGLAGYENLVDITLGYELLNYSGDKKTDKELIDTIAATWDRSNPLTDTKPAFDKAIIRKLTSDDDPRDFILVGNKVYKLPKGRVDEIINSLSDAYKDKYDELDNKELVV